MYKLLIFILSAAIIVSFFLPWFNIEQAQAGAVKRVFTKEGLYFVELSGFKMPLFMNGRDSGLILDLIKTVNPNARQAAEKSYLLWLVPVIAAGIYLGIKKKPDSIIINFLVACLGLGISVFTLYKLSTVNLDKIIVRFEIQQGFWITVISFFAIGVLGLLRINFLYNRKPKRD